MGPKSFFIQQIAMPAAELCQFSVARLCTKFRNSLLGKKRPRMSAGHNPGVRRSQRFWGRRFSNPVSGVKLLSVLAGQQWQHGWAHPHKSHSTRPPICLPVLGGAPVPTTSCPVLVHLRGDDIFQALATTTKPAEFLRLASKECDQKSSWVTLFADTCQQWYVPEGVDLSWTLWFYRSLPHADLPSSISYRFLC